MCGNLLPCEGSRVTGGHIIPLDQNLVYVRGEGETETEIEKYVLARAHVCSYAWAYVFANSLPVPLPHACKLLEGRESILSTSVFSELA